MPNWVRPFQYCETQLCSLQEWSGALAKTEPYEPPYLAHYEKDGKTLVYVAARHENYRSSDTFKLIERLFARHQFNLIIIEGYRNSAGTSPTHFLDYARSTSKDGFYQGGEPAFSALLATEKEDPFYWRRTRRSTESFKASRPKVTRLMTYSVTTW